MLEATLLSHDGVPGNVLDGTINRMAFEVHQTDALRCEHSHFAIAEEENISSVLKDRRDVACNEKLIFAQSHNYRRAKAGCDNLEPVARGQRN